MAVLMLRLVFVVELENFHWVLCTVLFLHLVMSALFYTSVGPIHLVEPLNGPYK